MGSVLGGGVQGRGASGDIVSLSDHPAPREKPLVDIARENDAEMKFLLAASRSTDIIATDA